MSPDDREFLAEARRHLVGLVGLIERYTGIEPVCRRCAGCKTCEALHRRTSSIAYTASEGARAPHVNAN